MSGYDQLDPNITALYDIPSFLPNSDGRLRSDKPYQFKMFGAYSFDWGLTLSEGFLLSAGVPISAQGPEIVNGYGDGTIFLQPRGSRDGPRLLERRLPRRLPAAARTPWRGPQHQRDPRRVQPVQQQRRSRGGSGLHVTRAMRTSTCGPTTRTSTSSATRSSIRACRRARSTSRPRSGSRRARCRSGSSSLSEDAEVAKDAEAQRRRGAVILCAFCRQLSSS